MELCIFIAMLIANIAMLIMSATCMKDVIKAREQIESDMRAIRLLHRAADLNKIEKENREKYYKTQVLGIFNESESQKWD